MPQLKFTVAADWQEVIKLKTQIDNLKASVTSLKGQMSSIDVNKDPLQASKLTNQLSEVTTKLRESENEVTKFGVKIGTDLKSQIYKASQTVNSLSGEIIKQKDIIRSTKDDVQRLSEQYKSMSKFDPNAFAVKGQLNSAKSALNEQKYALGELQSEQSKAKLSVKSLNDEFKLMGTDASASIGQIADKFRSLSTFAIAGIGIKDAIGQIISVRGDFENIETSIGVLLNGNKQKTTEVMNELKQYALISPLTTKDMAGALQMMMGFGLKAEDSVKYLKALGDISMGNTEHFNSLALAFSQMSSAGKLMGQDLNQMINSGFNPLYIISEKTGKSIGQLKQEMEKGAISTQMVQQAFIDATSVGGKFYGMAAAGAKTVKGQASMIQESFQNALNAIGQSNEGIILEGMQGATALVNNYETVGKVLLGLVSTYGAYRVAVSLAAETTKGYTLIETLCTRAMIIGESAQKALNASMLTNPYVAMAVAVGALVTVLWAAHDGLTGAQEAQDFLNRRVTEAQSKLKKYNDETENAIKLASDDANSSLDRKKGLDILISRYPNIIKKYIDEEGHLRNIIGLKQEIAAFDGKRSEAKGLAKDLKDAERFKKYADIINPKNKYTTTSVQRNEVRSQYSKDSGVNWLAASTTSDEKIYEFYASAASGTKYKAARTMTTKKVNKNIDEIAKMNNDELKKRADYYDKVNKKYGNKRISVKDPYTGDVISSSDIDKLYTEYSGAYSARTKKSVVNKSTLSETKKKLQAQLDSLSLKDAQGSKGASLRKQITSIDKQEESYSPSSDTKNEKAAASAEKKRLTRAEKERKQRVAIAEALKKQKEDINSADIDLNKKLADATISSEENEQNKRMLELEKSHKDELDAIDKSQRETLQKRQASAKNVYKASGGKGVFNEKSVTLSSDETEKFNQLRALSDKKYQKDKEKLQEEDVQALTDFYSKYGTYEEKKLAITKDYEKRISEATNEGSKMALTKQMEDALSALSSTNIKDYIDWDSVFGDLSNASSDYLKNLASQLKEILDTNKNLAVTDIKAIADKLQLVKNQLGKKDDWFYSPTLEKYSNAKENLKNAQSVYRDASAGSALASTSLQLQQSSVAGALGSVGINVNPTDLKSSDRTKYTNQITDTKSLAKVNSEFDKLSQAESKSVASKQKENDASKNLANASNKLKGSHLSLQQKVGAVGESLSSFGDKIKDLPDLMDSIGLGNTGVGKKVNAGVNAVGDAAAASADFASGNYIGAAVKSISAVKNVGRVLGIGGGNEAETQKTIDRLTKSNEYLKASIDGLSKKIDSASGADAAVLGLKAVSAQTNLEQNYMGILDAQMHYHGSHHSNAAKWDLSDSSMSTLINDKDLNAPWLQNSWDSFKKLTADQMDYIRTNYAQIWQEMINQGWYGDTFKDAWNNYADQAGKVKDLTDQVKKSMTQISFDDMYSSFTDSLMDMKKDAQSWADDLSNYLMKAMLKAQLDTTLKPDVQKFYDSFANDMSDNKIDSKERADLNTQWNDLIEKGKIIRDSVASATGYDTSSAATATKETSVSASQDSVSETNGRLTAVQEILIQGNTLTDLNLSESKLLNENMGKMIVNVDSINDTLSNSYAEIQGIHRDTTELKDIIKPIQQLGTDISTIKDKLKTL